jgi:hypothetical protein
LKQIGIGLHNYHDTYKALPAGWIYRGGAGKVNYGWATAILPFMEEPALYDQLDPGRTPLRARYKSGASATDKLLLQTTIETYRCPSDQSEKLCKSLQFGSSDYFDVAKSNYVACAAWSTPYPTKTTDSGGMFWGNSYLGFSDAIDGLSNTMLVSERRYRDHAATWLGVGRNDSYGNTGTLKTVFRAAFTINFDYKKAGASENVGKGWSSEHPGGLNVLLGDASVRFVSETTNPNNVLYPLAIRNDGKSFALP